MYSGDLVRKSKIYIAIHQVNMGSSSNVQTFLSSAYAVQRNGLSPMYVQRVLPKDAWFTKNSIPMLDEPLLKTTFIQFYKA